MTVLTGSTRLLYGLDIRFTTLKWGGLLQANFYVIIRGGKNAKVVLIHDQITSMVNDKYYLNIRRASQGVGLLSCGLVVTKILVAIEVDFKFCDRNRK